MVEKVAHSRLKAAGPVKLLLDDCWCQLWTFTL